jgi:hypothetical protein
MEDLTPVPQRWLSIDPKRVIEKLTFGFGALAGALRRGDGRRDHPKKSSGTAAGRPSEAWQTIRPYLGILRRFVSSITIRCMGRVAGDADPHASCSAMSVR